MSRWHTSAQRDPELNAVELSGPIASGDFQAAKEALQLRFGRHHPRHKYSMDVMIAAAQSQRLLRLREAQNNLDEARARNAKGMPFQRRR